MFSCRPILCLTSFAMAAATGLTSSRSAAEPVLPGIGPALQAMVDQHEIAGAVTVVVSKDGILHLENTGLADVASQKPMTAETLFWIASMTLKTAMSLNRRAQRTPKEPLVTQSRFTCGMSPSEAPFSMEMPYSVSFVPFCSIFHFPV
jgi:hypothetical protein